MVSWFFTIRIVDCTIWRHTPPISARTLYFIVNGIHPAADKCPVSASLVGRSSHVKLSVRSIARSILSCWSLRKRNQTVKQRRGNVEIHRKNMTKVLIIYIQNEILPKQASENWTLNIFSSLWNNNI